MKMNIESKHLDGLVVLQPEVFEDDRGFFVEAYRADQFKELGLPTNFVQDNHSRSGRGVLRGLHFQWEPEMGKLMRVTYGTAWLVAVDIRPGSATLGQWYGLEVSAANKLQIKEAVETAYGVTVEKVRTMNYGPKRRTRFTKTGVQKGKTVARKKAIVDVAEGDIIDFYSNL